MMPILMIVLVSLSVLFITLGTGANAAFKTPNNSSTIAMKFAFFMAVSYFCFYYIGVWVSGFLIDLMSEAKAMLKVTTAILFFAVAVKTIWNLFSYKAEDNVYNLSKTVIQLMLCIAGGFNALLLSIALTLSVAPHLKTALMVTLGAFIGSFSGAGLSEYSAQLVTKLRPAFIGGVILLVLAGIVYF
jgi:hypothetical protein